MNNDEYKKGINLYEDLVEEYMVQKIHHLIKEEKRINNADYLIKRLRENVYDSNLNQLAYKAFNDICLNTEDLIIPHPLMGQRDFVMIPLEEIAPDVAYKVRKGLFSMERGSFLDADTAKSSADNC